MEPLGFHASHSKAGKSGGCQLLPPKAPPAAPTAAVDWDPCCSARTFVSTLLKAIQGMFHSSTNGFHDENSLKNWTALVTEPPGVPIDIGATKPQAEERKF